jgi:predicted enzyme related to lactoylglutathione lyase
MPASVPAPSGAPCWIDLFSSDPDRATEFYGAIFGWEAEASGPEYGGYVNFSRNGVRVAGMMRNDGSAGQPDAWTTYLSVPDAKATTEAVRAAGGQVYMEPLQVGSLGTMGLVADPGGAAIGLWQSDDHRGYGVDSEPGAPCWHELHTRDYEGVLDFYRTAFGWETRVMSDAEDFRYTQMVSGDGEYAGVMDASGFLPEGVPSAWQIYLGVEDVDAAVARAVDLGGSLVEAPEETPYGRVARIADPTGVQIKVVQVPVPA